MELLDPVVYPQVLGSVSNSVNYSSLLSQLLILYVYAKKIQACCTYLSIPLL